MEKIINLLHQNGYSCIVENYGEVFTFHKQGVADLYDMVKNKPYFLKDASIADKVVGKAAAALIIVGGVKEVYADVISLCALLLLRNSGVEVEFTNVVPFIWNRDRTDCCPLEQMCYDKEKAEDVLPLIETFMRGIKERQIIRECV